jgi:hypothetical protein
MSVSAPSAGSGDSWGELKLKGVDARTVLSEQEIFREVGRLFPYTSPNIHTSMESVNIA